MEFAKHSHENQNKTIIVDSKVKSMMNSAMNLLPLRGHWTGFRMWQAFLSHWGN